MWIQPAGDILCYRTQIFQLSLEDTGGKSFPVIFQIFLKFGRKFPIFFKYILANFQIFQLISKVLRSCVSARNFCAILHVPIFPAFFPIWGFVTNFGRRKKRKLRFSLFPNYGRGGSIFSSLNVPWCAKNIHIFSSLSVRDMQGISILKHLVAAKMLSPQSFYNGSNFSL